MPRHGNTLLVNLSPSPTQLELNSAPAVAKVALIFSENSMWRQILRMWRQIIRILVNLSLAPAQLNSTWAEAKVALKTDLFQYNLIHIQYNLIHIKYNLIHIKYNLIHISV